MMNTQIPTINNSLADNINYLLGKVGVNATELARRTGLPPATIKTLRHGDHVNPTLTTLLAIAKFFSVTVSQLIGEEKLSCASHNTSPAKSIKEIPMLSWGNAGSWAETGMCDKQTIIVDIAEINVDYALKVEQDGLEGFPQGTILLIKADARPKNRDIVIIQKKTYVGTVLKQFLDEGDGSYLKSLNVGYPVVPCTEEHRILGVVKEMKRVLT